jgi:hypothetical protein
MGVMRPKRSALAVEGALEWHEWYNQSSQF